MTRTTKPSKKKQYDEISGWTIISVTKVPDMKDCARVKNRPLNILAMVLAQTYDVRVEFGERMISLLIPPDVPEGNLEVFQDSVLDYISLLETYSPEEDVECAMRIIKMAKDKGVEDSIGYGMFLNQLRTSYMEEYGYMIWTV